MLRMLTPKILSAALIHIRGKYSPSQLTGMSLQSTLMDVQLVRDLFGKLKVVVLIFRDKGLCKSSLGEKNNNLR